MANRSYLYALSADDKSMKDLSEWRSQIPLSHMLLLSGNTEAVSSKIWNNDYKIALRGEQKAGQQTLVAFLELLKKQSLPKQEDLNAEIDKTIAFLDQVENKKEFYWLEAGEVYSLYCNTAAEIGEENDRMVGNFREARADVERLIAMDSRDLLKDAKDYYVKEAIKDWQSELGLYWAKVLYFSFNKA